MAYIQVGNPGPAGGFDSAGQLPASLSILGWQSALTSQPPYGAYLFVETPPPGSTEHRSLNAYLDAAGNVSSITFRYLASGGGLVPVQFTATGLSIPKDIFLASKANIMTLVTAGNDTINGNQFDNILNGGTGNDQMFGLAGNDRLTGGDGSDYLYGGAGNDVLAPGRASALATAGEDIVDGGDGVDTVSFADILSWPTSTGQPGGVSADLFLGWANEHNTSPSAAKVFSKLVSIENIIGGGGYDYIGGNSGANALYGLGGHDQLYGREGNDVLSGGAGGDLHDGGEGIDTADYRASALAVNVNLTSGVHTGGDATGDGLISIENLIGSRFNDTLHGSGVANVMQGHDGNDFIYGLGGIDQLFGGAGNDILTGGAGADVLNGGDGIDTADYSASPASAGVYVILSSAGTASFGDAQGDSFVSIENINGSQFGDYIVGIDGDNVFRGNGGNDRLHAGGGNNQLFGGAGLDLLTSGSGADLLDGGADNDSLYGGGGGDRVYGGAGNDTVWGEDGNDMLRGDSGADIINGGLGTDQAEYTTSAVGVTVNLTVGTASDGDTLTGIENIYGSRHNDTLLGSAGVNVLFGYDGNDQLFGLAGNDNLSGQAGDDALFCGEGNDFAVGGEGNDGLFGEEGNDTLYGANGDDYLQGGDGNDVIWGDAGDDQIEAGAGNDFMVLGAGSDEFTLGLGDDRVRFDYGNGIDTIRDFGIGNDVIDFSATDMWLGVLQANTVQTSAGVLMTLGSGSILLADMQLSQIDWAGDFVFAV